MSTEEPPAEQWRPVPGYECLYSVSALGRIRSENREVVTANGLLRRYRGRILRLGTHRAGYQQASLSRSDRQVTRQVHPLVLEAFVGPRPDGMEACHNNGDPGDNRLSNLRWDTPQGNAADRLLHGTNASINKTHCPRRHSLAAPNLVACVADRGKRECLACNRARATQKNARRDGREVPDFAATADWHYARLMAEAEVAA